MNSFNRAKQIRSRLLKGRKNYRLIYGSIMCIEKNMLSNYQHIGPKIWTTIYPAHKFTLEKPNLMQRNIYDRMQSPISCGIFSWIFFFFVIFHLLFVFYLLSFFATFFFGLRSFFRRCFTTNASILFKFTQNILTAEIHWRCI